MSAIDPAKNSDGMQQTAPPSASARPLGELLAVACEGINSKSETGLATGFDDLDQKLQGLKAGQLVILASQPGHGKSALALNIVRHVAVDQGIPVAVFAPAMAGNELALRLLAAQSRIDLRELRSGQMSEGAWGQLADALGTLHQAPIDVDSAADLCPVRTALAAARQWPQRGGYGLLLVDDLQHLVVKNSGVSAAAGMAEVTRGLKLIAQDLHVPVLALSQIPGYRERGSERRARTFDIDNAGLDQRWCDVVLMLYREEVHNPETADKGIAQLTIKKQTNGPVGGTVRLCFMPEYQRFFTIQGDLRGSA